MRLIFRRALQKLTNFGRWLRRSLYLYWIGPWWHKLVIIAGTTLAVSFIIFQMIAQWYIMTANSRPLLLGASFIPSYAENFGLDAKDTLNSLINDVGIKNYRLVGYWDELEPEPGKYNFERLDWQFKMIEDSGGTISLSLGLRQPRWPECHQPTWAEQLTADDWQESLDDFISAVVERYHRSPALISYQLENEYFLSVFGECQNFDRQRLINEAQLVKKLDPSHTLIISRSNNGLGLPLGQPKPDESAISLYRTVWNETIYSGYYTHLEPARYYAFLAGLTKLTTGLDTIIHELQAEPWPPKGQPITETSLAEQDKSFNAAKLLKTYKFGLGTGMRQIYFWGAEYWQYRADILGDESVIKAAQQIFKDQN